MGFKKDQIDTDYCLHRLTEDWGTRASVTLYLDRCQVDTPQNVVAEVWRHIHERRSEITKVIDFGAGDGRFAHGGKYRQYIGYEIDAARCNSASLPPSAILLPKCAFSEVIVDADVCVGNPPYVRNQDLPEGWRQKVADTLLARTGVPLSGLSNAWQYFFLLSLASTKSDGLIAIVIPYEWVSRPSASALRAYIKNNEWGVSVYRLRDNTFHRVLTTSSITIIDKRNKASTWDFYEESEDGSFRKLASETDSADGIIKYTKRREIKKHGLHAKRGLSPGTQEILTLTEGERVRFGLEIGSDVVPCVTSLRTVTPDSLLLDEDNFKLYFRAVGAKCWLIRTDSSPSRRLKQYLDSIPEIKYQTATCLNREHWWKFAMPETPSLLVATGFRGASPKLMVNSVGAKAVGGVCGVYNAPIDECGRVAGFLKKIDLAESIVAHSNGLKKIEINQLNTLLRSIEEELELHKCS